jgi:hypothetical protein
VVYLDYTVSQASLIFEEVLCFNIGVSSLTSLGEGSSTYSSRVG